MLDRKNKQILSNLQKNGRITVKELSKIVGLSIPAVAERVKKMSNHGVIKEYRAILDPKILGTDVTSFILIIMASSKHYSDFVRNATKLKEVLECHSITGEGSHILKIRTQDTSSLESLLKKIQSWKDVIRTHTMIVMSTYKEDSYLEIQ